MEFLREKTRENPILRLICAANVLFFPQSACTAKKREIVQKDCEIINKESRKKQYRLENRMGMRFFQKAGRIVGWHSNK